MEAGREVLRRTDEYLEARESFAVETTLSGHQTLRTMREAKTRGFIMRFVYVALSTPEQNVQRVQSRVIKGGHNVSDTDVRRRYSRSIANVPECMRVADVVIDSRSSRSTICGRVARSAIGPRSRNLPERSASCA
jgi:predicted ABC-type ATPase